MVITRKQIDALWEMATPDSSLRDPNEFRKDFAGAWIRRDQFGSRSPLGWTASRIKPIIKGGTDDMENLMPCHWRNKMMKGELFEINDNNLKVVALDGHRLAIRNIELKDNYESKKVVVPAKTLNEISKIIPGFADEMVNIFITDNNIIFEFDNTIVVSRLIDGEYFKLDNMLSTDYKTKIKINKRQLLDSIDRASLMAKEGDKKPIIMDINDININLSITSVMGSMNENISIDKEGIDMRIGFNPKFFMDALKVIDDEEIIMYMVDPKAPCYIRDDNETFIYMILPININSAR